MAAGSRSLGERASETRQQQQKEAHTSTQQGLVGDWGWGIKEERVSKMSLTATARHDKGVISRTLDGSRVSDRIL